MIATPMALLHGHVLVAMDALRRAHDLALDNNAVDARMWAVITMLHWDLKKLAADVELLNADN